jgi:hypothetical protein
MLAQTFEAVEKKKRGAGPRCNAGPYGLNTEWSRTLSNNIEAPSADNGYQTMAAGV